MSPSLKIFIASLAVASAFKVDNTKPALDTALKLRGGLSLETTSLIGALYNGGFGVTLMANPDMFYGPGGLLPYFSTDIGVVSQTFFGRAFGAMLTAIAAMHFLDGPTVSLVKQMAISGLLVVYPMVLALMDTDNNFAAIWKPQIVVHLVLCYFLAKGGGLF